MLWCLIPSYFDYAEKHKTDQTKYQLFLEFQAFLISNICLLMIHNAYSSLIFSFCPDSSNFYERKPHKYYTYLSGCLDEKRQTNSNIFLRWSLILYTLLQLYSVLNQTAAVCAYDVPGDKNYRLQNMYDAQLKT